MFGTSLGLKLLRARRTDSSACSVVSRSPSIRSFRVRASATAPARVRTGPDLTSTPCAAGAPASRADHNQKSPLVHISHPPELPHARESLSRRGLAPAAAEDDKSWKAGLPPSSFETPASVR